jgi:hypothetical protein
VRMWDARTGAGSILGRHEGAVRALALSPHGRWLATGDRTGRLMLWDVAGRKLARDLHGYEGAILISLAFSADERYLASGGTDRPVRLWDLTAGSVRELVGHHHYVTALAFAPDGRTLASGCADGTIKLWDIAAASASGPGSVRTLAGHTGGVADLDFSRDGQRLVSAGSQDDTARLWDLATGESRIVRHHCTVLQATFVDDDRRVLSGRAELRVWSDEIPGESRALKAWIREHTDETVVESGAP